MENDLLFQHLLHLPHCKRETKLLLVAEFQSIHFDKGQIIFKPYLHDQDFYFVNSGLLRSYVKQNTCIQTRQLYIPGDFIVQNGLYIAQPTEEFIDCLSDVQLMHINYRQLELFLRKNPEAIKLLLAILQLRYLKELRNNQLLHIGLAIERYRFATILFGKFIHNIPKQVLASYLGLSRKHLSRLSAIEAHQKL